jgi:hypothetical protein
MEALRFVNDLYEMFRGMHDGFINVMSLMHEEHVPELRVNVICDVHRPMYSEFYVEEDDEKFVVAVTGCNNGGRLVRDGIAKRQNALTKKAYPWCFNKVGVPYNCCIHAATFNKIFRELGLKIELQWGKQYDDQGKLIDEPCRYKIYE